MARAGWYTDPFSRHEARWFSEGRPTSLVRDGGDTATDPPPEAPFVGDPSLVDPVALLAGDDRRRADIRPDDPDAVVDPVWAYSTRDRGGL